jgi:hypothetical protein
MEPSVFTRIHQALADADEEETQFGFEVSKEDPEGVADYQRVYDFAEALFASGVSLRLTPDVMRMFREDIAPRLEDDNGTLRVASEEPYIRPLLELRLARACVSSAETGMERLVELLDYLVKANLHATAQVYLESVARLYIWGFFTEAVVLARSALEAALDNPDPTKPHSRSRAKLQQKIERVGPKGAAILDQRNIDKADAIRDSGNDAVHKVFGCTREKAFVVIQDLGDVLNQLCSQMPDL